MGRSRAAPRECWVGGRLPCQWGRTQMPLSARHRKLSDSLSRCVAVLRGGEWHGRSAGGVISAVIVAGARALKKEPQHEHSQRDFQLVGWQHLVNRLYTSLQGKKRSTNAAGNHYYVQRKGIGPLGMPRRWVIYSNGAEASQITPDWHGWMHYTVDTPPTGKLPAATAPEPHRMNMTGTAQADRPRGSILATGADQGHRRRKPWRPAEVELGGVTLAPCSWQPSPRAKRDQTAASACGRRRTSNPSLMRRRAVGCRRHRLRLLGLCPEPAPRSCLKIRSPFFAALDKVTAKIAPGGALNRQPSSAPSRSAARLFLTPADQPPRPPPSCRRPGAARRQGAFCQLDVCGRPGLNAVEHPVLTSG